MSRPRLEAFSDGVFAIAITLLVLNLAIPLHAAGHLLNRLEAMWPSYVAYLTSFLVIGIVWVNHHRLCTFLAGVDRQLVYINLVLLLFTSTIPFPAALLSEYAGSADAPAATAVYGLWATLVSLCFVGMWLYLQRRPELVVPEQRERVVPAVRRSAVGPIVFGATTLLAVVAPWVATFIFFLTMLFFAVAWSPRLVGRRER
jgi:uncharacterized membrane protein